MFHGTQPSIAVDRDLVYEPLPIVPYSNLTTMSCSTRRDY